MARRYSRSASKDVEREMRAFKKGTLKSGPGGRGGKVKSRKQAIAIGLSEARRKGKKVPQRTTSRRKKGTLRSGSGAKVKSRKQAIAIGLSEARSKGAMVPRKKK